MPPQGPNLPPMGQPVGPQTPMQPMDMTAASAKKHHPWILISLLVVFVIATLVVSGFAFAIAGERDDYKNNVDEKVAAAVGVAVKEAEETKEREFLERNKSPYKKYKSPAVFGAVEVTYPKTWSATIDEKGSGNTPVVGYFHPDYVPGPKSGTAFALKIEVIESPYSVTLGRYESAAKRGAVKISPYKAKRVPSVLGARVNGEVEKGFQGSAVLFPLRDKTIRVSTLSRDSFGADFDKIILAQLIFTP